MNLLRQIIDTDRALVAKGGLYEFVQLAWPLVEPSPFVGNWHLEEICKHLEATSRNDIRRLVINIPPGTGKSLLTSVFWPAWEWIERPKTKYIYASFDVSLVRRDAGKHIALTQTKWFRDRWGERLLSASPAASDFANNAGGFRFSTSPAGKATGRHADIQVVDDPMKPRDAMGGATMTKNALRKVSEWWAGTMSSRLADPKTARRVIVMQRLHEEDLAGEMLATGDYEHLCLPMRFDPERACVTRWGGDSRERKGELLFPRRYPEDVVSKLETIEMGPEVADAQLQQLPSRKGGGVFKLDWFRFWHPTPGKPAPCLCERCWAIKGRSPSCLSIADRKTTPACVPLPIKGTDLQSWDCTFKRTDSSDFVAGGVWRSANGGIYLLDLVNARMDVSETMQAIRKMAAKFPTAHDKLIEDAANGPAIETLLRNELPGITLVRPLGGKEARANASSPHFSAGRVFIPHPDLFPWVWQYLTQMVTFPRGVNDDMVDMTTQALIKIREHGDRFAEAMARLREGR